MIWDIVNNEYYARLCDEEAEKVTKRFNNLKLVHFIDCAGIEKGEICDHCINDLNKGEPLPLAVRPQQKYVRENYEKWKFIRILVNRMFIMDMRLNELSKQAHVPTTAMFAMMMYGLSHKAPVIFKEKPDYRTRICEVLHIDVEVFNTAMVEDFANTKHHK